MKTIIRLGYALMVVAAFSLTSCVTKGKFLASEGRANRLQQDSAMTHTMLDDCNTLTTNLKGAKASLEREKADLQSKNSDLASKSSSLENQNSNLKDNLNDVTTKSKLTIEQQAKRLKDLQDLIQAQKDVMNKVRKSIADALVNFKPDELSVYIKDGNVYVSMEEKLLFKSGSAAVDPKGKEALGKLAGVLNTTSDITVQVEGHTDTIPIKTEKFDDNWALSVSRATSITRILTKDYGVDAHRITASGKGEFHPIQTNTTPEGRAKNRRTEIILVPNLDQLYKLLDQ